MLRRLINMQQICKIRKLDENEIAIISGFVFSFGMVKFRFKDGKIFEMKALRKMYDIEYIPPHDLYYYTGIISGLVELINETLIKNENSTFSDTVKKSCEILFDVAGEWREILENSGLEEFNGVQHVDIILPDTD